MEQLPTNPEKKVKTVSPFTSLKVRRDTKRRILAELGRINRKPFGREVTIDEVLLVTVCPVKDELVKTLQEATFSNADRIELAFKEHLSRYPGTSKDAFLGKLLLGEFSLGKDAGCFLTRQNPDRSPSKESMTVSEG